MPLSLKRIFLCLASIGLISGTIVFWYSPSMAEWEVTETVEVITKLPAYAKPDTNETIQFWLYPGMSFETEEVLFQEGLLMWLRLQAGGRDYWVPALTNGERKVRMKIADEPATVIDSYGILNEPHRYAVKFVKFHGPEEPRQRACGENCPDAALGRLETYEKTEEGYSFKNSYYVRYPQEGPKTHFKELKTVGGPVIRYLYRTERTSMEGRTEAGEEFGVFKVSYPMPHDAWSYFREGKMGTSGYNKIPAVNQIGEMLFPHPKSLMGADILIHTARRGSRGCINVENEEMGFLYNHDLLTENDRELIPFVIYDEDMTAPPEGELF